ncbi:transglutaminase family protein [Paenibacillus filicis]|uniref:Transglutaminase family protein n=1 Tax=Paenibacillus filicis TaxID=669464 RepID=A0ABU9DSQ9_9BACL
MNLLAESNDINDYLLETDEVDYSHSSIREKTHELYSHSPHEVDFVRSAFEFVRDHISHSCDIRSSRITYKASDVLQFKEGICYAKSLLLAALLRGNGIPTGFCYQRLTLGNTPDTGYALHALNAVYFRTMDQWIRLDARGNKPGVDAQFSLDAEQLAFPIRSHYDEIDYPIIYVNPNPQTIAVLKQSTNCIEMCQNHLPSEIK